MNKFSRLFVSLALLAVAFVIPGESPAAPPAWQGKVDAWVMETASQGETEFLIALREQADLSGAGKLHAKAEKGAFVYARSAQVAQRTQKPVLEALRKRGVEHRSYWIVNAIRVRGGMDLVQEMALRADVAHIYANPKVKLEAPPASLLTEASPASPDTVVWNIARVRAPEVWALGYTGQGAVVGGADTGYQWDHPALKDQYRGWNGYAKDHNYNWHDATNTAGDPCLTLTEPCDPYGHGTHTMGTMVGDGGATHQIGMAPGARWIGCRNMDHRGYGTPESYIKCYQWFVAPTDLNDKNPRPDLAPDVINNSWACLTSEGCLSDNPNILLDAVEAVRAAGILTVHSAGNNGLACETIRYPASIYEASFTVGATDMNDNIASFSSRGPVTVDGSNRLKPNVSAPGTSICSSIPVSSYSCSYYGTSMAAPHVAGLVALLISVRPDLAGQVDEIETIIEGSAVPRTTSQICGDIPGSQVPNNTYGWGRIDALAAISRAYPHQLSIQKSVSPGLIVPWLPSTYTIQVANLHPFMLTTNVVVTDILPANTTFITATLPHTRTGDLVEWGFAGLGPGEAASVELVVQASPGVTVSITNQLYGARSAEAPTILGPPLETFVTNHLFYLPLVSKDSSP